MTVDLPGFGESRERGRRFTPEECSDQLAYLIGALGLEGPVVVGHGMVTSGTFASDQASGRLRSKFSKSTKAT
jgi:pimeloyl-ACP methyl ester carboxylesterase